MIQIEFDLKLGSFFNPTKNKILFCFESCLVDKLHVQPLKLTQRVESTTMKRIFFWSNRKRELN